MGCDYDNPTQWSYVKCTNKSYPNGWNWGEWRTGTPGELQIYCNQDPNCHAVNYKKNEGGGHLATYGTDIHDNSYVDIYRKVSKLPECYGNAKDSRYKKYACVGYGGIFMERHVPKAGENSVASCGNKCDSIPGCAGFVYRSNGSECWMKGDLSDTNHLNNVYEPNFSTYLRKAGKAKHQCENNAGNTNYTKYTCTDSGGSLITGHTPGANENSVNSCANKCDTTPGCSGFVYKADGSYCWLKNDLDADNVLSTNSSNKTNTGLSTYRRKAGRVLPNCESLANLEGYTKYECKDYAANHLMGTGAASWMQASPTALKDKCDATEGCGGFVYDAKDMKGGWLKTGMTDIAYLSSPARDENYTVYKRNVVNAKCNDGANIDGYTLYKCTNYGQSQASLWVEGDVNKVKTACENMNNCGGFVYDVKDNKGGWLKELMLESDLEQNKGKDITTSVYRRNALVRKCETNTELNEYDKYQCIGYQGSDLDVGWFPVDVNLTKGEKIQKCAQKCNTSQGCGGFVYNSIPGDGCWMKGKLEDENYLKTATRDNTYATYRRKTIVPLSCGSDPVQAGFTKYGCSNYGGGFISEHLETPGECATRCKNKAGCGGFVVESGKNKCWLKDKMYPSSKTQDDRFSVYIIDPNQRKCQNYTQPVEGYTKANCKTVAGVPNYKDISFDQCREECEKTHGCGGYVLDLPNEKGCWMKGAVTANDLMDDDKYVTYHKNGSTTIIHPDDTQGCVEANYTGINEYQDLAKPSILDLAIGETFQHEAACNYADYAGKPNVKCAANGEFDAERDEKVGCKCKGLCTPNCSRSLCRRVNYSGDPEHCCIKRFRSYIESNKDREAALGEGIREDFKTCDPKYRKYEEGHCDQYLKNYCKTGNNLFNDPLCAAWIRSRHTSLTNPVDIGTEILTEVCTDANIDKPQCGCIKAIKDAAINLSSSGSVPAHCIYKSCSNNESAIKTFDQVNTPCNVTNCVINANDLQFVNSNEGQFNIDFVQQCSNETQNSTMNDTSNNGNNISDTTKSNLQNDSSTGFSFVNPDGSWNSFTIVLVVILILICLVGGGIFIRSMFK